MSNVWIALIVASWIKSLHDFMLFSRYVPVTCIAIITTSACWCMRVAAHVLALSSWRVRVSVSTCRCRDPLVCASWTAPLSMLVLGRCHVHVHVRNRCSNYTLRNGNIDVQRRRTDDRHVHACHCHAHVCITCTCTCTYMHTCSCTCQCQVYGMYMSSNMYM